jgi:hypothetical protein
MKSQLSLILGICCFSILPLTAQKAPKWMDKSKKAVFTVTTYNKDNLRISSTNGFFVSETGEAISAYSLFKGAGRATVTDTDGNTWQVASILGADELYDVIKFKVAVPKKVAFLPVASNPIAVGSAVLLLPYSTTKEVAYKEGAITETSKLKDSYIYYKLSFPLDEGRVNSPLLLPTGEVFALAQDDASGKKQFSYGVSASYVNALRLSSTDVFNTTYTAIGIQKAWIADLEQANIEIGRAHV